ncbi:MAG: glycosyltransferase [Nitrospinae bacterium]|nr:glycosyltransferase [Nitrospinota bacterium]
MLSHFTTEMKAGIYSDDFLSKVSSEDSFALLFEKYRDADADNFLDKTLYADVMTYLPDDLLVKVDIASMANSLEARSPFLDHEFMEFAARIPAELKLKGWTTKYILKQAMKGILPDEILTRKKMGFVVPIDHWFRNELKDMACDILLSEKAMQRGYFKKEAVKKILDEHTSGKWKWHNHIWNLLMLELWHRVVILGTGELMEDLRRSTVALGITEVVVFRGNVPNVLDYLQVTDLYLLTSEAEGMPNSLLEAMACRLPVIATKIGGVVDVIESGRNGILVPCGDVSALRDAILFLLSDPSERERLAVEAYRTIRENYYIEAVASRYADLYRSLPGAV